MKPNLVAVNESTDPTSTTSTATSNTTSNLGTNTVSYSHNAPGAGPTTAEAALLLNVGRSRRTVQSPPSATSPVMRHSHAYSNGLLQERHTQPGPTHCTGTCCFPSSGTDDNARSSACVSPAMSPPSAVHMYTPQQPSSSLRTMVQQDLQAHRTRSRVRPHASSPESSNSSSSSYQQPEDDPLSRFINNRIHDAINRRFSDSQSPPRRSSMSYGLLSNGSISCSSNHADRLLLPPPPPRSNATLTHSKSDTELTRLMRSQAQPPFSSSHQNVHQLFDQYSNLHHPRVYLSRDAAPMSNGVEASRSRHIPIMPPPTAHIVREISSPTSNREVPAVRHLQPDMSNERYELTYSIGTDREAQEIKQSIKNSLVNPPSQSTSFKRRVKLRWERQNTDNSPKPSSTVKRSVSNDSLGDQFGSDWNLKSSTEKVQSVLKLKYIVIYRYILF